MTLWRIARRRYCWRSPTDVIRRRTRKIVAHTSLRRRKLVRVEFLREGRRLRAKSTTSDTQPRGGQKRKMSGQTEKKIDHENRRLGCSIPPLCTARLPRVQIRGIVGHPFLLRRAYQRRPPRDQGDSSSRARPPQVQFSIGDSSKRSPRDHVSGIAFLPPFL